MQEKIRSLVKSRRFWIAVSGIVVVISQELGLTTLSADQIQNICMMLGSLVLGESIRSSESAAVK